MAAFYDSPRGEAYEWLIDFATERSEMFMVARRGYFVCIDGEDRFTLAGEGNPEWMEGAGRVFALLEPYLVKEYTVTSEEHEQRFERGESSIVRGHFICTAAAKNLRLC